MTVHTVVDGKMTNEQLGEMTRRMDEIKRRVNEETIAYDWAIDKLQRIVEGRTAVEPRQWNVWKTIELGTPGLRTADDFRRALRDGGFKLGDWANDILGKPPFEAATEETGVDLVVKSVAELGFKDGATRRQIYNRAKELGLNLCPAEVGPQLRLQYKDQSVGEWILIAMEPILDSAGDPRVFIVECVDSGLWLYGSRYGGPDYFWLLGVRWLFVRPRK